jgi:hypothetical protein
MAKIKSRNLPPPKLVKGKLYTKTELGLQPEHFPRGHVKFKGKEYLFVSIKNGKYMDELHADGVVLEVQKKDLVKYNSASFVKTKGRHIMVRFVGEGDIEYEYIGDENYICRYDPKRNKIMVE